MFIKRVNFAVQVYVTKVNYYVIVIIFVSDGGR